MTRQEMIEKGNVWVLTDYRENPDGQQLFEGNKTACRKYVSQKRLSRLVKRGLVCFGRLF